jgi:hypothetical protein
MAEPAAGGRGPGAAVSLAAGVVGVGALFLPWLAVARYGTISVAAWVFHLVVGALLVTALGARAEPARTPQPGLLAVALRAVPRYYLLGVSVGQAVVASVAGGFLATAAGVSASWAVSALAVLVPAAASGATGRRGPEWTPYAMLAVIVVVAAIAATGGGIAAGPSSVTGAGKAAFVMLFAFVGWEGAARLRGTRAGLLLAGAGLVGLVYVGLALFAAGAAGRAGAGEPGLPFPLAPFGHDALGRGVAAVAGVVCAVACARNFALVKVLGGAEFPRLKSPMWMVVPAAAAASGVLLLDAGWVRLEDLLSVPNAMALAVFGTAAAGAFATGRPATRLAAGAALLGYALLVPFAGLALAWPAAVLLATALTRYLRRNRGAPHQLRRL